MLTLPALPTVKFYNLLPTCVLPMCLHDSLVSESLLGFKLTINFTVSSEVKLYLRGKIPPRGNRGPCPLRLALPRPLCSFVANEAKKMCVCGARICKFQSRGRRNPGDVVVTLIKYSSFIFQPLSLSSSLSPSLSLSLSRRGSGAYNAMLYSDSEQRRPSSFPTCTTHLWQGTSFRHSAAPHNNFYAKEAVIMARESGCG